MRWRLILFAAALLTASAAAQGTETPENPFGRTVTALERIGESCGKHYPVDEESLRRYRAAFAGAGERVLGEDAFRAAVERGRLRRSREIAAAGARAWCLAERASLLAIGLDHLFPTETLLAGEAPPKVQAASAFSASGIL